MNFRLPGKARALPSLLAILFSLLVASGCGLVVDNSERLERAKEALAAGDYRIVTIESKTVLQDEPDNVEARLLLARGSLGLYDGPTAETNLRRAIELGAPLNEVAVDLGRALMLNGDFEAVLAEISRDLATDQAQKHAIMQLRADARMGIGLTVVARSVYEEILEEDEGNINARLGVASSYAAEGDYEAARNEIDIALELAPDNVRAWLASGSIASDAQDSATALAHYQHASELAEASASARDKVAALSGIVEAHLTLGNLEAAQASLQPLLQLAPEDIGVKYLVARTAFVSKDYDAADASLREVLQVSPSFLPGRLLMGAVQLELGRLGQAESYVSGVISAAPRSHEARAILAEIRMRQGRADDVAAILDPVLDSAGDEIRTLAVRASLQSGQHETTINYLREQLAKDPDSPDLQMQLAAALVVTGDHEEAQAILANVSADTDESAFQRDMIGVYSLLGQAKGDEALREATALAQRFDDDPRAHNLLGTVAMALGRLEQARASFAEGQEILPNSISTYMNIAAIDIQLGDVGAARDQLTAAQKLQPGSPNIMVALARLEGRAGDTAAARGWLEKAREAAPRDMTTLVFLTRFLLSEDDAAGAETVAREALTIDADVPAAHNLLGLALEGQDKQAEAIEQFEKALQLAPEEREYQSNLVRALMASGDFAAAERALTASGGVNLDDIDQASMVAALRVRQGDLKGALNIADSLKQKHPGTGAPFAIEAELLAADGQYAKASEAYDKALLLSGSDRSLAFRAFVVRKRGNLPDPEAPLLDYLRIQPADAEIRRNVAFSFQSRGEAQKAVEHFELALRDAPNDVQVLAGLAKSLAETGDTDRAATLLEKALAESNDFPGRDDAKRLLEKLRN